MNWKKQIKKAERTEISTRVAKISDLTIDLSLMAKDEQKGKELFYKINTLLKEILKHDKGD
jgi:uncharacterized pyridoxamine 5'-phosphate oxidase family protein